MSGLTTALHEPASLGPKAREFTLLVATGGCSWRVVCFCSTLLGERCVGFFFLTYSFFLLFPPFFFALKSHICMFTNMPLQLSFSSLICSAGYYRWCRLRVLDVFFMFVTRKISLVQLLV